MSEHWEERLRFVARRFIAGSSPDDALRVVAQLNAAGLSATLDVLGEDVLGPEEAARNRQVYVRLLDALAQRPLDVNVSVKLSALGLRVSEELALENLAAVAAAASRTRDSFVRVDMEGSALADATLRVVEAAFTRGANVGPALQAALKRTPADVERAIALGMRVRLCKGAYREPAALALADPAPVRAAFLRCAEALLVRGRYPALATHDAHIVAAVQRFCKLRGIGPERYEFQLLYGVRPELRDDLRRAGHRVRVYVPFGTHWARYFARRVAERPEIALFAVRAVVGI